MVSKVQKTIKKEITSKISLATLVILVVIFGFVIYNFRTVQIDKAKEHMKKIMNNIAARVDSRNQEMNNLLDMMVNYQQLSGFGKREKSIDYLIKLLEDNPNLLGASYYYEPNADNNDSNYINLSKVSKLTATVNKTGRFLPAVIRERKINLSQERDIDKQLYQVTKKNKEVTIGEPINFAMRTVLPHAAPLMIKEDFKGLAVVKRSLSQIQSDFYNLNSFNTAEFYLLSPNDRLLTTSGDRKDFIKSREQNNKIDIKQGKVIKEKEDKFIVSQGIETGNWEVFMTVEKSEILESINVMTRNMVLLGFLAVIFLSLLLYYLIYTSLNPISAATEFAQNLAEERFDIADLNTDLQNEVGQLSQALNEMKSSLTAKINKINQNNYRLAKGKNKLQKYLNIAEVIFVVVNQDGQVTLINNKGAEVFGLSKEEIIGQDIQNFILEEEREEIINEAKKLYTGEKELLTNYETTIVNNKGEKRTIIWNSTVLKDESGEVEETLNSGMDITEKRSLRKELEYSQFKTQFFANLSHEFKTPLNLIFSALQMLNLVQKTKESLAEDGKFDKYTSIIKQNSYRLLRLVNNLVDITKINANSFELSFSNYNIVELIENMVLSVEDYVKNKERNLYFKTDLTEEVMACDFFSLERIMLNLISNAVKFTDEGDDIIVSLAKEDSEIMISVKDTGVGIPEVKKGEIFKKFSQVDKSFTRNHEGSGIGLSLVKSLVELHEGQIRVESQLEEGSEFIIRLPIRQVEEEDSPKNHPQDLCERIELEFSDIHTQ